MKATATATATATQTSLKKGIRSVSNATTTETVTKTSLKSEIVLLQTFNFSVAQLLAIFSGCEF